MASQPHNLSAAAAMGAQFKTNILDKTPGALTNIAKASVAHQRARTQTATQGRERAAASALNLVNQGRANVAKQAQSRMNTAHSEALRQNSARDRARNTQVNTAHGAALREDTSRQKSQTSQVNTAHVAALREGANRSATITRQRNTAHDEALKGIATQNTTMTRQRNFAHGEALKESKQRSKLTSPGTPRVSAPRAASAPPSGGPVTSTQTANVTPAPVHGTTPRQTFRGSPAPSVHTEMQRRMGGSGQILDVDRRPTSPQQFRSPGQEARSRMADVRPRDNSPYPTHQHPAGSSNMKLESLTAAQPKPNEFTVGSRANKPGGIASKGSQLEAWAISKQKATQARTASRRAGGRDKDLAATAKKAENFSNQPLKNFAP